MKYLRLISTFCLFLCVLISSAHNVSAQDPIKINYPDFTKTKKATIIQVSDVNKFVLDVDGKKVTCFLLGVMKKDSNINVEDIQKVNKWLNGSSVYICHGKMDVSGDSNGNRYLYLFLQDKTFINVEIVRFEYACAEKDSKCYYSKHILNVDRKENINKYNIYSNDMSVSSNETIVKTSIPLEDIYNSYPPPSKSFSINESDKFKYSSKKDNILQINNSSQIKSRSNILNSKSHTHSSIPNKGYIYGNRSQTTKGQPIMTGPRGGRYHYSASGKKVYEKRRR